jgi:2-methylcitrate dehydratase PrpD
MSKVVLTKDARIEEKFPAEWPARVEVQLTNGERFEKHVRFPKGDPENPLGWPELTAKFSSLATRVIPRERSEQIIRLISEMDASSNLLDIWKWTAVPAAARSKATN